MSLTMTALARSISSESEQGEAPDDAGSVVVLVSMGSRVLIGRSLQMKSVEDEFADAAARGDLEAVEQFIAAGADIDAHGANWNPLHAAIENEHIDVIRCLVDAGADLEALCYGGTGLAHAVDLLIDGARQNQKPVEHEPTDIVDFLIDSGADIGPGIATARSYYCSYMEDHLLSRVEQSEQGTPPNRA